MKKLFLLIVSVLFAVLLFAQTPPDTIHPGGMSNTAKEQYRVALGIPVIEAELDSTVKNINIVDPAPYIDSVAADMPPRIISTNYTLEYGDIGQVLLFSSESDIVVTIPTNLSVDFPVGITLNGFRYGGGEVSFTGISGVTLVAPGNRKRVSETYQPFNIWQSTINTWVLSGGLKE